MESKKHNRKASTQDTHLLREEEDLHRLPSSATGNGDPI